MCRNLHGINRLVGRRMPNRIGKCSFDSQSLLPPATTGSRVASTGSNTAKSVEPDRIQIIHCRSSIRYPGLERCTAEGRKGGSGGGGSGRRCWRWAVEGDSGVVVGGSIGDSLSSICVAVGRKQQQSHPYIEDAARKKKTKIPRIYFFIIHPLRFPSEHEPSVSVGLGCCQTTARVDFARAEPLHFRVARVPVRRLESRYVDPRGFSVNRDREPFTDCNGLRPTVDRQPFPSPVLGFECRIGGG